MFAFFARVAGAATVAIVAIAIATTVVAALFTGPAWAQARENIHIVGSSTVYPFVTVAAERFGRATKFKTPIIEATGSGGGMKLFCAGIGSAHPDFTNSSRRIKKSEFEQCVDNGVTDIIEIKIGYDGIVIANSRASQQMELTRRDIFLALAKRVPDATGALVDNPHRTWREVNPALPATRIEVLGPPPTSGTRDAFVELAMEGGCREFAALAALRAADKTAYLAACHHLREDGAFVEAGENDNLIVQKLIASPNAFGIFGFSFLDQNADRVQGALVDGVAPEFETIADGDYPIARPLYLYAKAAHIDTVAGMREFMAELTAEDTWGEDGYLADRGLIPMPDAERAQYRRAVEGSVRLEGVE